MFPYDTDLLAAAQATPSTIADVIAVMQSIDALCTDGDGLKWFNLVYLQVTQAVQARVDAGDFKNPVWMAALDVDFAAYYFRAVANSLSGHPAPGCWQAVFNRRNQVELARIQFALAGMNAHINHDLPQALLSSCSVAGTQPLHGTAQYFDFTALNSTLDSLIDRAKVDLRLRLLGDSLPPASLVEDALAAFSLSTAREAAWDNAEALWRLRGIAPAATAWMDSIDVNTCLAAEALLLPV